MSDVIALKRENFRMRQQIEAMQAGTPTDVVPVPARVLEAAAKLLRDEGYHQTAQQLFVNLRNG